MQLSYHALAFGLCIPVAAITGFLINEYFWRRHLLPRRVKRAYVEGLRRSRLQPSPPWEQIMGRIDRRNAKVTVLPREETCQTVSRNTQPE
jgi:hypothetical protein